MVTRRKVKLYRDTEFPAARESATRQNAAPELSDQGLLRAAARDARQWQARLTKARANGGRTPGLRR